MKIIVHGFKKYEVTPNEFVDILNQVQMGVNQDCNIDIEVNLFPKKSIKLPLKQWQLVSNIILALNP